MRFCTPSNTSRSEEGFEMTWLDVSPEGLIDPDQLENAIRPETTLVSIMAANNETGVIQPMEEISARCKKHGVLLHSDMVQSFGKLDSPRRVLPEGRASARLESPLCHAASFGAHKFYGPKGAGFLYLRSESADRPYPIWRRARGRTPPGNREHPGDCGHGRGRGSNPAGFA